jgi:FG-GAP-like repeat
VSETWDVPAEGRLGFVVRLNRGGSFGPASLYRTGDAFSGTLADLNGDGKPEVAVTRGPGKVSLFLNRNGRFDPAVDFGARGFGNVDAVDMNGDGKADLVTSDGSPGLEDPNPSFVSVLVNKPGLCNVQDAEFELRLAAAKRQLARAGCRVKVSFVHRWNDWKGYVIDQKPAFGAVLPRGAKVSLVVNLGKR